MKNFFDAVPNHEKPKKSKKEKAKKALAVGLSAVNMAQVAFEQEAQAKIPDENLKQQTEIQEVKKKSKEEDSEMNDAIKKARNDLEAVYQKNDFSEKLRSGEITPDQILEQAICVDEQFDGLLKLNKELLPDAVMGDLENNPRWVTMDYFKDGEIVGSQKTEIADEMFFKDEKIDFDKREYSVAERGELNLQDSVATEDTQEHEQENVYAEEEKENAIEKSKVSELMRNILSGNKNVNNYTEKPIDNDSVVFYARIEKNTGEEYGISVLGKTDHNSRKDIVEVNVVTKESPKTIYTGSNMDELENAVQNNLDSVAPEEQREQENFDELHAEYSLNILRMMEQAGFQKTDLSTGDNATSISFLKGNKEYHMDIHFNDVQGGRLNMDIDLDGNSFSANSDNYESKISNFILNFDVEKENALRNLRQESFGNIRTILTEQGFVQKTSDIFDSSSQNNFIDFFKEGMDDSVTVGVFIDKDKNDALFFVDSGKESIEANYSDYENKIFNFVSAL